MDLLSKGRLLLGLGLGWWTEELRVFGKRAQGRVGCLVDAVEIVRRAAFGERFSYRGVGTELSGVRITPAPMREIPVWFGGAAAPALRRAGSLADGFIASQCSPEDFRLRLAEVDRGAKEAGRPHPVSAAILLDVWPGEPGENVVAGVWAASDVYSAWRSGMDVAGSELRLPVHQASDVPPRLIHGTPEHIASRIFAFAAAAGERDLLSSVRLTYPGVDLASSSDAVARFGRDVMPLLTTANSSPKEGSLHGSR